MTRMTADLRGSDRRPDLSLPDPRSSAVIRGHPRHPRHPRSNFFPGTGRRTLSPPLPDSSRSPRPMTRLRSALAAFLVAGPALAQDAPRPPAAKKVPHATELHGDTRTDD